MKTKFCICWLMILLYFCFRYAQTYLQKKKRHPPQTMQNCRILHSAWLTAWAGFQSTGGTTWRPTWCWSSESTVKRRMRIKVTESIGDLRHTATSRPAVTFRADRHHRTMQRLCQTRGKHQIRMDLLTILYGCSSNKHPYVLHITVSINRIIVTKLSS